MSVSVLVDAGVLLYSVDDQDIAKRDQARLWLKWCWERRCGRTSAQVLNEFYDSACRQFASLISRGDARAEVRRYQHWQPWLTDHQTVESAWAIEARYGLSYGDSLVVAAAQQQGCRYLLTEELPHGQQIDGVQAVNPFKIHPTELLDVA